MFGAGATPPPGMQQEPIMVGCTAGDIASMTGAATVGVEPLVRAGIAGVCMPPIIIGDCMPPIIEGCMAPIIMGFIIIGFMLAIGFAIGLAIGICPIPIPIWPIWPICPIWFIIMVGIIIIIGFIIMPIIGFIADIGLDVDVLAGGARDGVISASFFSPFRSCFASRIRAPITADGFRQPSRLPRSSTNSWISGSIDLSCRAAMSSTLLSLMKSSTSGFTG
mmetsp:Transcript_50495/g.142263  ORF Transcript_50495/g.142263 Transcript_50495/m.142263 type:complete len:221 (+) Transcript_50495:174-836(+)